MKFARFPSKNALLCVAATCLALSAGPGTATMLAQTSTWTGAVNNSWGTPGNWSKAPAFDGTDQLVLSTLVQPSQMVGATRAIHSLTFTQGGFAVTGNALTLYNSGAGIFSTGNNTISTDLYPQVPVTYQSDSGTLTLAGVVIANSSYYPDPPAAPTLTGTGNFTVSGSIQGAGGLVMNSTGTLLLSGTNYNAGSLTINSGVLKLAAANTLASQGALIINANGTFDLNGVSPTVQYLNGTGSILLGNNTLTVSATGDYASPNFSGTVSGNGGLIIQMPSSGVQTLGGTNTYQGGTTIKSGLVAYNADANFGALSGSLTLNGGGLQFLQSTTLGRTVTVGAGGVLFTTNYANATVALPMPITGSGPVTYASGSNGNNLWVPTGNNTYSGTTNLSGGSVVITADAQLGAAGGAVVPSNGSVLLRGGVTIPGRALSPGGGNYYGGVSIGALVSDTGSNTWTGPVTTNTYGSVSTVGATAGAALTLSGPVSGSGTLAVLSTGDTLLSGTITMAPLSKNSTGTLTLSGNNASGGAVTVYAGTLVLQGGNAVADNVGLSLANGATVRLQASETVGTIANYSTAGGTIDLGSSDLTLNSGGNFGGVITGAGRVFMEGTGTLTLSGQNTFTGGLYIDSGTLVVGSDASFGAVGSPVVFRGGTLGVYGSTFPSTSHPLTFSTPDVSLNIYNGTFTLAQALSNSGSLTKLGTGTLVLTGNNSYGGGTVLSAGTLSVSSDAVLGAAGSGITLQGGTLQVTGNIFHSTARAIISSTATSGFEVVDPGNTFTLGAVTGSAGGINKLGAGTLVLAGQTPLTTATASAGTLRLGASNVLPVNTSINAASGATFDLAGYDQTVAYAGAAGTLSTGTGTLSVSGTLVGSALGVVSGRVALTGPSTTLFSNPGSTWTLAAVVSGSGTLTALGGGSATLTADNPFSGTLTVNSTVNVTGSLTHLASAMVAQGGVFQITGGHVQTTGDVTNSGLLQLDGTATFTANGSLTNNGFLRLTGSATLAAGGTITNNGVLDISAWNGVLPSNVINGKGGVVLNSAGLQIAAITHSSMTVQVTINAQVGLGYLLQRTTSLSPANWQGAGTTSTPQTVSANGPLVLTDLHSPTTGSAFYRVIVTQSSVPTGK